MRRALGALFFGVLVVGLATVSAAFSRKTVTKYEPAQRAYETVYVTNHSQFVSNADVENAMPAFQAAASKDFAPAWKVNAHLVFLGRQKAPRGSIYIDLLDRSDVKGALAYHTVIDGTPLSRIFIGTSKLYGYSWTVGFTHELWEMLADPSITRSEQGAKQTDVTFWAAEVADPVESDSDGYTRPGANGKPVLISDFITDKWFDAAVKGPYDFMNHIQSPYEIDLGGYAQYWDGFGWQIVENFRAGTGDNRFLLGEAAEAAAARGA